MDFRYYGTIAVEGAFFMTGWALSLHAEAGPTFMAGGLVMVCSAAHFLGNEFRTSVEADKGRILLKSIEGQERQSNAAAIERAHTVNQPVIQKPRINIFQQGQQVLNQVVSTPKLDYERILARKLIEMRDGGFPMNISETYWIREAHWKEGPESFRAIRSKWEYYKIVGKRGSASNSRYQIENERGVELIATGRLDLPTPPR
jgi:hypothetical protein